MEMRMKIVGVTLLVLLFITSTLFAEARDYPKYEHEITRQKRDQEDKTRIGVVGGGVSRRRCRRRGRSKRCRSPFPIVPSPPPPFFPWLPSPNHAPPAVIFPPPLVLSPPPLVVFPPPRNGPKPVFPWVAPPNPGLPLTPSPPLVPVYSDPPPFFHFSPPVPDFPPPDFSTPAQPLVPVFSPPQE